MLCKGKAAAIEHNPVLAVVLDDDVAVRHAGVDQVGLGDLGQVIPVNRGNRVGRGSPDRAQNSLERHSDRP